MLIPSDAVMHTAEILALRHCAPTTYRQVTRLYTAYLRGIDRMPRNRVVDKRYLLDELERGRVSALAINCNRHLRLVGYTAGGVVEYPEALLICSDVLITSAKRRNDQRLASARQELLRQACLRYATDHRLIYDLSLRHRRRRTVMWRSPCGTTIDNYRLQGCRLLRS